MKKLILLISLVTCMMMTGCQKNEDKTANKENTKVESAMNEEEIDQEITEFPVKINNKEYKMPFRFDEVMAEEWSIEEGQDGILEGGLVDSGSDEVKITNGKEIVYVRFQNTGDKDLPYSECRVGAMTFYKDEISKNAKIVFPKNITLNSTKSEVLKAYGEDRYDSERNLISLWHGQTSGMTVYFDDKGKNIKSIEVTGFFI